MMRILIRNSVTRLYKIGMSIAVCSISQPPSQLYYSCIVAVENWISKIVANHTCHNDIHYNSISTSVLPCLISAITLFEY